MSTFSIGSMNQLGDAFKEVGITKEQDITDLRSNKRLLAQLRELMLGSAKITYLVKKGCFKKPSNFFKVKKEVGLPQSFEWNPARFIPFISDSQVAGRLIKVEQLCELVACKLLMNADVAHVLWTHQWLIDEIIPEESKIRRILFVGTVYQDEYNLCYVPCLEKDPHYHIRSEEPKWCLRLTYTADYFNKDTVVALRD